MKEGQYLVIDPARKECIGPEHETLEAAQDVVRSRGRETHILKGENDAK